MSKEVTTKQLTQELEKRIELFGAGFISQVAYSVEKKAQSNFNRARKVTGSDEDKTVVTVKHSTATTSFGYSTTITCTGNQVLFMEFGAGVNNKYVRTIEHTDEGTVARFTRLQSTWINAGVKGEIESLQFNIPPRPAGIYDLGRYIGSTSVFKSDVSKNAVLNFGKKRRLFSRGSDDMWVRPSSTGIPNLSAGETHVHKRNGEVRENVVWTYGTPPTRSLYRAVISTLNGGSKR